MLGQVLTAIVTPFKRDGAVDLDSFRALARHLVDNGSDGLVVTGTTGESPTLSDDERFELYAAALDEVGDRATVVAGTGTYSTAHTVHLTERAHELGAHAFLIVTPYYNKPPPQWWLTSLCSTGVNRRDDPSVPAAGCQASDCGCRIEACSARC